jgi:hypothetical protein
MWPPVLLFQILLPLGEFLFSLYWFLHLFVMKDTKISVLFFFLRRPARFLFAGIARQSPPAATIGL